MRDIILEMRNISKSFEYVQALKDVDFSVREGEIHGIVGENGHRQAMTLAKILGGLYAYGTYEGEIVYRGEVRKFLKPVDSRDAGISFISPRFEQLLPEMNLYENISLGCEVKLLGPFINWKKTIKKAEELLEKVNLNVSPDTKVRKLRPAQRQRLAMAKALGKGRDILVMDDPSIILNEEETEELFHLIRDLQKEGTTFVIASRKPEEIVHMDVVTVLKGGKNLCILQGREEIRESEILRAVADRELEDFYPEEKQKSVLGNLFGGWFFR